MAAGLTDHVWTLREVLWFRVPPWPQPQALSEPEPEDDREAERFRCASKQAKSTERGPEPRFAA
jgi:hypothetical protein